MKAAVAADIRAIFNAQDRTEADGLLRRAVQKYEATAPKLAAWLEENLPEGLAAFDFPEPHRRLLRTTNGVERVNREVRRRTRVASIFPNEASCLRLASAVLMEISDDWQAGKAYLTFAEQAVTNPWPSKDAPSFYRKNLTLSAAQRSAIKQAMKFMGCDGKERAGGGKR